MGGGGIIVEVITNNRSLRNLKHTQRWLGMRKKEMSRKHLEFTSNGAFFPLIFSTFINILFLNKTGPLWRVILNNHCITLKTETETELAH